MCSSKLLPLTLVLSIFLTITPSVDAQNRPSLKDLRETNVALLMEGFTFSSGIERTSSGEIKSTNDGFEMIPIRWAGSGFIAAKDGSVITNYHVARRALRGLAKFDSGAQYEIQHLKVYDPENDLAVLKLKSTEIFPTVSIGNSENTEPLDDVIAVGNPQGEGINITKGSVSQVVKDDHNNVSIIRHTAIVTSGNSGGALYKGPHVIGVNVSVMLGPHGGQTGFSQSIPVNKAKLLLDEYKDQAVPLSNVFPTDPETIMGTKFQQIHAANGEVPAASSSSEPGVSNFGFTFGILKDYLILLESPGKDLAIVVLNAEGIPIGIGNREEVGYDGVIIPSGYPENVTINVLNYEDQPAQFGIIVGYIQW